MSIRTKSGDQGFSDLKPGRLPKSDPIFECLGDLDELSAVLGLCGDYAWLQTALLDLGSAISGYAAFPHKVQDLEIKLKELEDNLPKLQTFILPDNQLHMARAICRRAERHFWAIPDGDPELGKWLNCLSDFLFQEARSKSDGDVRYKQSKGIF